MKKKKSITPEDTHPLGKGAGRKQKGIVKASTQQVIDYSAPEAAKILRDVVKGTRKRISAARQRACEFIINHAIGTPTQKVPVRLPGTPITYEELAKSAETVIKAAQDAGKSREDVIKQAEAVATRAAEELNREAKTADTAERPVEPDIS